MRPCASLVDDDETTLPVLSEVVRLDLPTLTVQTSSSAGDALERLSMWPYHAVLSDVRMPAMDGVTFLEIKTLRQITPSS